MTSGIELSTKCTVLRVANPAPPSGSPAVRHSPTRPSSTLSKHQEPAEQPRTSPARHARIAWVKSSYSQTGIRSANLSLDARREICLTMFSSQSSAPQLWCAALTLPPGRTAPCCGIFDSAFPATPLPALALPRPDAAAALRPATRLPAHGRYARLRQVPG